MVGYGPERHYFALELTANYGIEEYEKADDLRYIAIRANDVDEPFVPFRRSYMIRKANELGYAVDESADGTFITGPDG